MARFCPLFSGSRGNSTYIGCSGKGILIDAGVSCKAITEALSVNGVSTGEIAAVFITHEHNDHITGLHAVAAKLGIPVFASQATLDTLGEMGKLSRLETRVMSDEPVEIGGMTVERFATPHDCNGSSGYVVIAPDGRKIAVATDIGHLTDEIKTAVSGCDLVMIESNHDVMMLENGTYPYPLKRRILSDNGHLSNACCSEFLPELIRSGTTRIVLAHLSRDNNHPSIALQSARTSLTLCGFDEGSDYTLSAAAPSGSRMIVL